MTTRDNLLSALDDANVQAFLRVIREGESNQNDDAYTLINGGGHFDSLEEHPWYGIPTTQGAKACGAYQFLGTTCKETAERYQIAGFSPRAQDMLAVGLIADAGALSDVLWGDLEKAIGKLRGKWTSLPGASENSGRYTMEKAREVFAQYGGKLGVVPTIGFQMPKKEEEKPVTPLALSPLVSVFASAISEIIPQVANAFNPKSEVAKRNVALAQIVADKFVAASGEKNLQSAVEAVQANPTLAKSVQQAVVTDPEVMGLLEIGGGIPAAREMNKAIQGDNPFWYNPAIWISAMLLLFPLMLAFDVFYIHPASYTGEVRVQIITAFLAVILVISGYWLGTSESGARKNKVIANMAEGK